MKRSLLVAVLSGGAALNGGGSLIISAVNTATVIDFETALAGVNPAAFDGSGFSPTPAAGQLDSDAFSVTGMSDGALSFSGSATTGDFARGSSAGGVTTGGVYAFDVGGGDIVLGLQPGGGDFTPGDITLQIQNTTGFAIPTWNIAYDLFVFNDQARANSLNFSFATGTTVNTPGAFTPVGALDFSSAELEDASPAWVRTARSTTLGALVGNNEFLYLRWTGDDATGSGSRDEFGLDDISITAVPEPSEALVLLAGLTGLLCGSRRRRSPPPSWCSVRIN